MYPAFIAASRKHFDHLIGRMANADTDSLVMERAKTAARFAAATSTGHFSSPLIEQALAGIARRHHTDMSADFIPGSFLHVMTEAYQTGGHTRVVERWIDISPEHQRHSLVFTGNERQTITERLLNAVKAKSGEVIRLRDEWDDLRKGLSLRGIASGYEYIVLHVHMDDIVPLLAFGTEEFTRPVIFFNHADHKFWLGVSIADVVADLREWGKKVSRERRGIPDSDILSLPIDSFRIQRADQTTAKEKLRLPVDAKILVTVGSAYKYAPWGVWNFLEVAEELLRANPDLHILAVGPDAKEPAWKALSEKTNGRLRALGEIRYGMLHDYLHAADMALDSFPMPGGTAMMDALASGCPVASLENPIGQFDYLYRADVVRPDKEALTTYVNTLLGDRDLREENLQKTYAELQKENFPETWYARLCQILPTENARHAVRDCTHDDGKTTILDEYIAYECLHRAKKRTILRIRPFIEIILVKKVSAKFLLLTIFGKERVITFTRFKYR